MAMTRPISEQVKFTQEGTGAVERLASEKLGEWVSVKDFGAVGDGVTDDTAAIQAALNAGAGPVYFPPGIYVVSSEVVVPDGSGIVGAGAHWKRRTGYAYGGEQQTVIKYTGIGGAGTCVVRASNQSVGVQGGDFNAGDGVTDDLINVVMRDFHVDANSLAWCGVYVYRAGNQSSIGNITAEKATQYCHVHLGCYAAQFGTFGAYESGQHGVAIGWDVFGWGSIECTCFAYRARFLTANNGISGTYVAGGATDLDGSGGLFSVGRGSKILITSEGNDGRACLLSQPLVTGGTSGPSFYVLEYIEGNADGPYIDYRSGNDSIYVQDGFVHPGNGGTLLPQNIKIEAKSNAGVVTTDAGPSNPGEWLTLERLHGDLGGVGFSIDSNSYKYRVIDCTPFVQFGASRPGSGSFLMAIEGATTAGSSSYTARTGYYWRVGNLVHVTGRIELSALDALTAGQLRISGLPLRVALYSGHFGVVTIGLWHSLTTPVVRLDGTLTGGNSHIDLFKTTSASVSSLTGLVRADLTAASMIQFSASYLTDV